MKFSKQALLGTTVLLGGSVLLYATMHQVLNAPAKPEANSQQVIAKPMTDKQSANSNEPLTADIATEKNLLAQKQKEREQRVAAQEQQAQQYMTEQQRIEAKALARSRAENQLYANKNAANTNSVVASSVTAITQPVVKPRPVDTVAAPPQTQAAVPNSVQNTAQGQSAAQTKEQVATQKPTVTAPVVAQPQPAAKTIPSNPGTYQVKAGEGLIGLSRRYSVPVDVLASVNNLNTTSSLRVGQTITIPTAAQVNRITQQAQAREQNSSLLRSRCFAGCGVSLCFQFVFKHLSLVHSILLAVNELTKVVERLAPADTKTAPHYIALQCHIIVAEAECVQPQASALRKQILKAEVSAEINTGC